VFYTRSPGKLAEDLAAHQAVDLVTYPDGAGGVVVRAGREQARITRAASQPDQPAGYRYQTLAGDPLKLAPILEKLRAAGQVSPDGVINDQALFAATAEHEYPDPLHRVWLAFNGLMVNAPDVIVSLKDPDYHGWPFFDFMVREASTHGSLNRRASETFALSTRGPLPPLLRQEQILPALGVTWPAAATRPDAK
jgi:hypothetical protein